MIDKSLGGIATNTPPAPWDGDPVVTPAAPSATPWADDPESADNGKGRVRSALETFVQTGQRGVGKAIEGLGSFAGVLIDAERGGDQASTMSEIQSLERVYGKALKLPRTPDVEALLTENRRRASYLRDTLTAKNLTEYGRESGVKVGEDAETRFAPNPAYAGEFFADTVPQVGGSAVASVAPFMVPGGQVAGVAAMFGQTYQTTVDENLAKGVDEETAIERGLLNGIASGGLEAVGEGIVVNAMKKLAAAKTLKGAARHVIESTASEAVTGAAQEATGELIDEEKLNPVEIVKQGALEALGGFMLAGGAVTVGKVIDATTKPKVDAAKPWAADPESSAVTLGEEGKPMEADPFQEVQAPAPIVKAAPTATVEPVPVATTPAPVPAVTKPLDPYLLRNRNRQDAAGLGWTAEALNKLSDTELQEVVAERRRYVAPPDPRTKIIVEAARAQRKELAERRAFERGELSETEDASDAQSHGGEDEEIVDPDNIPFSAQPSPQGDAEAGRLRGIMEQQWRDVGENAPPAVIVVQSARDIPQQLGGETVRKAVQTGQVVEAFFITTKKKSGDLVRRIIVVRDGAMQVASDRAIALEDRVRQLALHEIVHHYGSLGALFQESQAFKGAYDKMVNGLLRRMQTSDPQLLDYLTRSKEDGGYGYDIGTEKGRADTVEEYLARFAESETAAPGWFAEVMAQIRSFLRAAFPGLAWTDSDVRALLASARKRAAAAVGTREGLQGSYAGRKATGFKDAQARGRVFKGKYDEKDRFEIDDRDAKIIANWKTVDQRGAMTTGAVKLSDVLDHPSLYEEYPTLRDLKTEIVYKRGESVLGQYGGNPDPKQRYIQMRVGDVGDIRTVLMHEVQHAIQEIEGFAPGDSVARVKNTEEFRQQVADAEAAANMIQSSWEVLPPETNADLIARNMYRRSAGEIEARDVEGRLDYSPADREGTRPYSTESIPKEGAIIRKRSRDWARESILWLRNNGFNPSDWGFTDPTDYIALAQSKGMHIPEIQMSAQPSQQSAEEAGRSPEARRRFMESVAAAPGIAPMSQGLESIYQPITNKETVEAAKTRINEHGLDRALAEVLATGAGNPPTALTNVMGIELMGRLQALHRYEETAALAEHMAAQATTQGQAIQALSLLARLTPEGINIYTQRVLQRAGKADPEMVRMAEMIRKLQEELRNVKMRNGTAAILDLGALIDEAAKLSPEEKVALMRKLREALLLSNTEEGKALARLTQIAMDAGIKRDQAVRLARRAVEAFRKAQKASRGKLLREMLRAAVDGASRAPMPKTNVEKWLAMNEEGILDDETMFAGIAKKWGLPVFTKEHAARVQELQRAYDAAPVGDLKLAAAAKMLQSIHELVPVDFWTKVRAVRNMVMLFNPKTIIRNIGGNVALWLADAPADTLSWGLDKATSVVTGARTRTGLQMAAKFKGMTAPVSDFKAGYDYAKQQGQAHGLWKAGVDHMLTMARLTSGGVFHEGGIQSGFRHVFSSRVMRLLEDGLSLALGVPDRAFHQGAFQSSLARQMDAEFANTGTRPVSPTPAMFEAALLDANAAVFQDDNVVSQALKAMQRTLNLNKWGSDEKKFGLGNIIVPFTQVPGSIAARAAGVWSPIGLIRGVYEGRHLLYNRGAFDQRAFTDLLSRGALGTGLGFLGYYLFRLGIMSALPEDDPDREAMRKAAGLGQYRINVSELLRRMVSGNWSTPAGMLEAAQDGDEVRNYDWLQPLAVPLAAGAQIAAQEDDRARTLAHGKTVSDLAAPLQALAAGMQTLEAQPLVSSFTRFMRDAGRESTPGQPVAGVTGALLKAFTEELASGFIPTAVRQIGQLGDNTERETRATPLFGISAAVPGMSEKFPPKYDVMGEMQQRYQAGTNTAVNVLLNPAFATQVKADPVLREMDALYERTGDPGVTLPLSKRSVNVNQRTLELTNEQRSDYARVSGQVATSLLRELIAAPAYATLPDDTKAKVAASRISAAGTAAKMILFGHRPDSASVDVRRAILHARALGLVNPRQ